MIKLLDCTLRDGGYVNNWEFGNAVIKNITSELVSSGIDIIEVGFLKNEIYQNNRTVFNDVKQMSSFLPAKSDNVQFAAMIDAMNPIPLDSICDRNDSSIDIIRVMVWKSKHDENNNVVDCLHDGYEYCKRVVEKGYKLCIQPARVDQYSDEEFIEMIKLFSKLNPMAIYVVDSWGTLLPEQILHYAMIADTILPVDIAIGYHGHNNMLQAFGAAVDFLNLPTSRDLFVDASIYGIGRCAGNLNLEIIAKYLNVQKNASYDINALTRIYVEYISSIREKTNWGYSFPYFLTGVNNCHPNYANYLIYERNVSLDLFEKVVNMLEGDDKILFTKSLAEKYLESVK